MNKKTEYDIYTLSAANMVKFFRIKEDRTGLVFEYDFNHSVIKNAALKSTDTYGDCGMFRQLEMVIGETDNISIFGNYSVTDDEISEDGRRSALMHSLIFVDFSETALWEGDSGITPAINVMQDNDGMKGAYILGAWGDPGFSVKFEGENEFRKFVPFEKSASMSRNSCISYIREDLLEKINQRLNNGMNFESINVVLSKFYAYRGLYFTEGNRIETDENFVLDENKVIVLLSDTVDVDADCKIYTAVKGESPGRFEYLEVDYEKGRLQNKDVSGIGEQLKTEPFDGEGIISPEYAELINRQLKEKHGFVRPATSFQIRMPFTKGMLHQVDFNSFLSSDRNGLDEMKNVLPSSDEPFIVKDFLGIERDLRKAEIIINTSMFKCGKWLKSCFDGLGEDAKKSYNGDAMKFYFDNFRNLRHSLFISNTDVTIAGRDHVKLNYQFLNTLDLSADGGEAEKKIVSLIRTQLDLLNNFKYEDAEETDEDEESAENAGVSEKKKQSAFEKAISLNNKFLEDPHIDLIRSGERKELTGDLGKGKITVMGEQRFISRDLFALMMDIVKGYLKCADKYKGGNKDACKQAIKNHSLHSDRFYMPCSTFPLRFDWYYAILRNPHLSRNEQTAVRPFVEKENNGIYGKYFGHLTGVVMVGYTSFISDTLSGADFDGDIVKIIGNAEINKAVLKGCYKLLPDDNKKRKLYMRKDDVRIIKIPAGTENPAEAGKYPPYSGIRNSFFNKIGQISNSAIRIGKLEYSPDSGSAYKNRCAQCTIVTGLEIDAAKTGIHPGSNINEIIKISKECMKNAEYNPRGNDYFITHKSLVPAYLQAKNGTVKLTEDRKTGDAVSYRVSAPYSEIKEVYDFTGSQKYIPSLDYIPYYFYSALSKNCHTGGSNTIPGSGDMFDFGGIKTDSALKKKFTAVVRAYKDILAESSKIYRGNEFRKKISGKNAGAVEVILKKQYDSAEDKLPVLDSLYSELFSKLFSNSETYIERCSEAIKKVYEKNWAFTEKGSREKVLEEILGFSPDKDKTALLTNFSFGGYMLLPRILIDIAFSYDVEADENPEKITSDIKDADSETYSDCYKKLYGIFRKNYEEKKTTAALKKSLLSECRKQVRSILGKDNYCVGTAMAYFWEVRKSVDKSGDFFWSFFSPDEIEKFVKPAVNSDDRGESSYA